MFLATVLQAIGLLTLHTAAQEANLPLMRQMIEQHANVNEVDKKGATPLFYTANLGTVEGARLLLENGANINHSTQGGGTALHSALLKKHEALSLFLIEQRADVNKNTIAGVAPLHMAVQNGLPTVVEALLKRGAKVEALTNAELSPMSIALMALARGDAKAGESLRLLLDAGAKTDKILIEVLLMKLPPDDSRAFAQAIIAAAGPKHPQVRDLVEQLLNKEAVAEQADKLHSAILGKLTQAEEDYLQDWWYGPAIEIPFWDGRKIVVVYEFNPVKDPEFIKEADAALAAFLKKTPQDRLALTPLLRESCQSTCAVTDIAKESVTQWLAAESGEGLWAALSPPEEIFVKRRHRRDKDVYVSMSMPCEWLELLAFVYRQGRQLTRLSYADGWLTEADAFNTEDSQDPMLSSFDSSI